MGATACHGTWDHRKELLGRELEGILGNSVELEVGMPFILRSIITHLLLPVITARSQCHGAAQDVTFCLAVCTEAKSSVVELKMDIHIDVNLTSTVRMP